MIQVNHMLKRAGSVIDTVVKKATLKAAEIALVHDKIAAAQVEQPVRGLSVYHAVIGSRCDWIVCSEAVQMNETDVRYSRVLILSTTSAAFSA